ncbi:MAG: pyruvate kinase, partial [Fimbriimonadales bacterium]|nr:pyruvate kinase [Fimbriimonadales bacterium]
ELVEAGMNVARINTAHGDWDTRRQWIGWIREAEARYGVPIATMLDLAGPKVRIGMLPAPLMLQEGQPVRFVLPESPSPHEGGEGTGEGVLIPLPVPELFRVAQPNDRLLVDDGSIELRITRVLASEIEAVVLEGGELRSQRGITLPNRTLALPSMTPKDREDLKQGLDAGVDWIALSFIRSVSDVLNLQALIKEHGADTPVIAKIEQRSALDDLEEIIEASDGVMVARGDLGVQVDLAEVPALQKRIIRLCNARAKPVITATQMLESMIREGRPTRAEVTDVANAVLDGSDALMLSGETAIGAYPVQAVRWMARIAEHAEEELLRLNGLIRSADLTGQAETAARHSTTEAVARAACLVAEMVDAKAILTPTTSGGTPRWVSHFRPAQPILALTDNERLWRRLALLWGVAPLRIPRVSSTDEMTTQALIAARQTRLVHRGDRVVLTAGVPVNVPGNTNMIQVLTIER